MRLMTTTRSSSESPETLYVPGKSLTTTVQPFLTMAPSSKVTVVPG